MRITNMCILPYIVIYVMAAAQCSQEENMLQPQLIDLIKRLANIETTEPKELNLADKFLDLTRKETEEDHGAELNRPSSRSDMEIDVRNIKHKKKVLVSRIIPQIVLMRPDAHVHYRPLPKIHKAQLLYDISDSNTIQRSDIVGNDEYDNKNTFKVFKIMKNDKDDDIVEPKLNLSKIYVRDIRDELQVKNTDKKLQNVLYVIRASSNNNKNRNENTGNRQIKYPPWNYWTYWKSIHQDSCPGQQVKVGNLCINTPPH